MVPLKMIFDIEGTFKGVTEGIINCICQFFVDNWYLQLTSEISKVIEKPKKDYWRYFENISVSLKASLKVFLIGFFDHWYH